MERYLFLLLIFILIASCKNMDTENIDNQKFDQILSDISLGWNSGNAELASKLKCQVFCFVYLTTKQYSLSLQSDGGYTKHTEANQ